jgi:hypothetical protein
MAGLFVYAARVSVARVTPPFRRLLHAQILHAAGDALIAVSLADSLFFSVPIGEARDRVALYLLLTVTPFAVVAPVVGPLLDRWRGAYRLGVIVSAAGRAVIAFMIASRVDVVTLYPLAFAALVLSRAHGVSRTALVPDAVPEGKTLMWANARLSIVSLVAATVCGIPGIGIQKAFGAGWTLRIAGLVYIAGTLIAAALPKQEVVAVPAAEHRSALLQPHLIAAGAATTALRAAIGFIMFFLSFELRNSGHGAPGILAVAAAATAGGLAGAVAGGRLRGVTRRWFLTAALGAVTLMMFLLASNFGLPNAVAAMLIVGGAASFGRLAFDSLIQRDAPEEIRGRTFARYEMIFQLGWVGGAGLGTVVPFGGTGGLRVAGFIALGGIVFAARAARRSPAVPD